MIDSRSDRVPHGVSSLWSSLVKTALLGTARQSFPPASLSEQCESGGQDAIVQTLAHTLAHVDWRHPSGGVLDAVGAIALYQTVGASPQSIPLARTHPALNGPALDPRPLCSAQTAKYLRHGLRHDRDVCLELLTLLIEHQQKIPEEYLPALLDFGLHHPTAQDVICSLIGEKGRWLAKQHSSWTYAQWDWSTLPTEPDREGHFDASEGSVHLPGEMAPVWRTGTPAQRSNILSRWRAIAPNAARALLESVWSQEPAKHRTLLLPSLSEGLSLADESFLEQTLSDRSASVRSIAAHLLARLPQSQWCQRMTEWGRSLLAFVPWDAPSSGPRSGTAAQPSSSSGLRLQVTLPTLSSKPLPDPQKTSVLNSSGSSSSGANSSSPASSSSVQPSVASHSIPGNRASNHVLSWSVPLPPLMGPKASTQAPQSASNATDPTYRLQIEGLIQIIASMPLEYWSTVAEPESLIATVQAHEKGEMVMRGWELATVRQQHPLWAETLLRYHLSQLGMVATVSTRDNPFEPCAAPSVPDEKWMSELLHILSPNHRERLLLEMTPAATRQQISLLSETSFAKDKSSPYGIDVSLGAADGDAMALWLHLAVTVTSSWETSALSPTDCPKTTKAQRRPSSGQGWSLEFSQIVLSQLYREISHHQPAFIRQVRTLAKAIAMGLDPRLSETPILGDLADRSIPGPASMERSWDQAIDIIRSTLELRHNVHKTFIQENSG